MTLFCSPDKPGPPEDFKTTEVTENSVGLSWQEPRDNGGSEVTSYTVERRDATKRQWAKVAKTPDLDLIASDLTEGQSYMFRVAAENEMGMGEFVELPRAVVPKSEHGT